MLWHMPWHACHDICHGTCPGKQAHDRAYHGICRGMPWHLALHAIAYAMACHGILRGIPWLAYAKAYAMACHAMWYGMSWHVPWHGMASGMAHLLGLASSSHLTEIISRNRNHRTQKLNLRKAPLTRKLEMLIQSVNWNCKLAMYPVAPIESAS